MTWCCEFNACNRFVNDASPNDVMIYYVGASIQDSLLSKNIGGFLYRRSVEGLCYLVMKRSKNFIGEFEHMVVKASKHPVLRLIPMSNEKRLEKEDRIVSKGQVRYGNLNGARHNGEVETVS